MSQESVIIKQEENISPHIFSVSAAMVGVCLTAIGLINISSAIKKIGTNCDDLTALNAVIFLVSCFLSYQAMKTNDRKQRLFFGKLADRVFLIGLFLMVLICIDIVYMFSA